jgi:chromosome segregation ATPase
MSWLQIALAALTLINLAFVLAAAYLLNEILRSTESSKTELIKAARESSEAAHSLLVAARRSVAEMERVHQAHLSNENSNGRAIHEMSRQMKILSDAVAMQSSRPAERSTEKLAKDDQTAENERATEDAQAKLRSDLNVALSKNHQLQDEIDQTRYRLSTLADSHQEMEQELRDSKDMRTDQVQRLLLQLEEQGADLEQAQQRAKAAEKHAEANARLLDDIREQTNAKWFDAPAGAPDQSGLIQSLQDQIEALAGREAKLMQQLADLEDALKRNLTEKEFIEERFLKIVPTITP